MGPCVQRSLAQKTVTVGASVLSVRLAVVPSASVSTVGRAYRAMLNRARTNAVGTDIACMAHATAGAISAALRAKRKRARTCAASTAFVKTRRRTPRAFVRKDGPMKIVIAWHARRKRQKQEHAGATASVGRRNGYRTMETAPARKAGRALRATYQRAQISVIFVESASLASAYARRAGLVTRVTRCSAKIYAPATGTAW